jgi:transcriptional regulator with XRE-family HTH domain
LIPADEPRGSFGALLRVHRSASGLTQEDLAERSGVSIRAIADMERGRTTRPFRHSVHRLADALELPGGERERLVYASRSVAANMLAAGRDAIAAAANQRLLASRTETGPGQRTELRPATERGQEAAEGRETGDDQQTGRGQQAGRGQRAVPRQLPRPAADFVGRAGELRTLNGALAGRGLACGTAPILAIVGSAGVGKTTLAVHSAHQVADSFPDGQLYVDLRGFEVVGDPLTPADAIRGFVHTLGAPSARLPVAVHAAAGHYRSMLAGLRVLIVLDNARDAEQVRPLLPGDPACAVVVTSRNQLTGLVVADGARPLFLDVLTKPDASELLARRLGVQRLADEPRAAEELIGLSGRLPLALAAVSARAVASPRLALRDLATELRDSGRRLDAVETGEPATSLRAKLTGSYRLLTDAAARMLRLLGRRSGPEFSAAAAAMLAGIPLSQARTILRELALSSLVTEHPGDRFAFHPFMHSYAAERASAASEPGAGVAAF